MWWAIIFHLGEIMKRNNIEITFMLNKNEFNDICPESLDDLKTWIDVIKYYDTDDYDIITNLLNIDGFFEMAEGIFCSDKLNKRDDIKNYLILKGYKWI